MTDIAVLDHALVGALQANLLGQTGLDVTIYERDGGHPLPRAVHVNAESASSSRPG